MSDRMAGWPQPIRSNGPIKLRSQSSAVKSVARSQAMSSSPRENPWVQIHSRFAAAIESGQWDPAEHKRWFALDFPQLVPRNGCACEANLADTLARCPIDWSTADTAFDSFVAMHNYVSQHHVKPAKPTVSIELARALYLQQTTVDEIELVTSLSLQPHHQARQAICLRTWQRAGFRVHAVNSQSEIDLLQPDYSIDCWHACEDVSTIYDRPTQTVWSLAQLAVHLDKPILLLNSDIEIHGPQSMLLDPLLDGCQIIGIRHNYASRWWQSKREEWGFDAFSFTPDQARSLPRLPLGIGRPVWDYWLPLHFRKQWGQQEFIGEPFFYHKIHAIHWSRDDWDIGARVLSDAYDYPIGCISKALRNSLPFPPRQGKP